MCKREAPAAGEGISGSWITWLIVDYALAKRIGVGKQYFGVVAIVVVCIEMGEVRSTCLKRMYRFWNNYIQLCVYDCKGCNVVRLYSATVNNTLGCDVEESHAQAVLDRKWCCGVYI